MSLQISPRANLDNMVKGEEASFSLNLADELNGNTVASHTFKVFNSSDADVTADYGGGNSISGNVISFDVKAFDTGNYTLQFWVTCNETLPDAATPYQFFVNMTVTIA